MMFKSNGIIKLFLKPKLSFIKKKITQNIRTKITAENIYQVAQKFKFVLILKLTNPDHRGVWTNNVSILACHEPNYMTKNINLGT